MSKWVLISVDNNDIEEPDVFDTYEQAYERMEIFYNALKDDCIDCNIHDDYASIQSDYCNWDWRIFEVKGI